MVLRPGREKFGQEIACRTGEYRDDKVPSDLLRITLKYGKSTTTFIYSAFQYLENPILVDYHPRASFKWSVCFSGSTAVDCNVFDLIWSVDSGPFYFIVSDCFSDVSGWAGLCLCFCLAVGL